MMEGLIKSSKAHGLVDSRCIIDAVLYFLLGGERRPWYKTDAITFNGSGAAFFCYTEF